MLAGLKHLLYAVAFILLVLTCYLGYDWYMSDPENKEPLPALLSFGSSLIALIIAWLSENNTSDKSNVKVEKIERGALVDVDLKENTNYSLKNIKGEKTKIYIGKGKDSLKNNNPS